MVAARLIRADQRPAGPGEPACLPLLLGREAVGRDAPHAPVDAQRSLTPVLDRELRVGGQAQDVAVGVDDHRSALPWAQPPCRCRRRRGRRYRLGCRGRPALACARPGRGRAPARYPASIADYTQRTGGVVDMLSSSYTM